MLCPRRSKVSAFCRSDTMLSLKPHGETTKTDQDVISLDSFGGDVDVFIKGSLVEKLPSYGDLKMQRVQYSNSSSSSAK